MKTIIVVAFVIFMCVGWVKNLVHVFNLDFKAPYKAEIIRCAAIPLGYGAFIGWIPIKDGDDRLQTKPE